ncbi:Crp/Fnr family transcriptional regulator [Frisingicoccus sp.]|uniref:Crp/Fnr family transcriptional regulator n=1 Tax=Frisingicoccus sp. TaxID=1918627 RepID=UPI0025BD81DB|nr:Crp/Fnr family transcriptional regulator [Frisingicoccus sp.]
MEMYAEAIKKCRLFMNLPLAVIQRDILPMAHVQDISKGKYMIMYQDYVDYFGIIISGKVHILHIYSNGETSLMNVLGPHQVIGIDLICTRTKISPYYAMASVPSKVLFIPSDFLFRQGTLDESYRLDILNKLLIMISHDNIKKEYRLAILAQKGLRERIMTYLTMQADKRGSRKIKIPFSRDELASFLCVNRSALSHELSLMQQEGIIRFRKNEFELLE